MSLRATAASALDRHVKSPAASGLREVTAGASDGGTASDMAAQLIRYIPAELVAGYIAVVGVLPLTDDGSVCQSDFTARWVAFAVFLVLCPIALQMLYVVKRRSLSGVGPRVPLFEHGAALTAFVAWALVLPLTPAATWCGWQPQYGAAIAVVVLLLLGLVAQVTRPAGKQ